MMNWLFNKIAILLARWCIRTNNVHFITGGPKGETVYLIRYIVFKSKYGCIYIHRFMRSDADDPHDHPWNFWTYILNGEYKEYYYDRDRPKINRNRFIDYWTRVVNVRKKGSLAYRKATDVHRVVLDRSYDMKDVHKAPFTICFMGPRRREWGFWISSGTFVDWRRYLKIKPNDARIEGSE